MKGLEEVHVYYRDHVMVNRVELKTHDRVVELPAGSVRQIKRVVAIGTLPAVEVTFRGRLVEHGPEEVPDGA